MSGGVSSSHKEGSQRADSRALAGPVSTWPKIRSEADLYAQLQELAERRMEATFPDWVPSRVRAFAGILVTTDFDPAPVKRLATDPRMRAVWSELAKRRRDTCGFYFHQSRPGVTKDQQTAMADLFSVALEFYKRLPFAVSRSDLRQLRAYWQEHAAGLRESNAELLRRGIDSDKITKLGLAAELWEQAATAAAVEPRTQGDRRRTNPQLRGLLIGLLAVTRTLFGDPLYGVVATIASVLLERNIRRSLVRQCDSSRSK